MSTDAGFDIFACPHCRSALNSVYSPREGAECRSCGRHYEKKNGVLRFVDDQEYCGSFGLQWNRHAASQIDSMNGTRISHDRLAATTGWPQRLKDDLVLEAGSGAGRFTEVLLEAGARVFSFDYSTAVDANFKNNGADERLTLFQADIFRLPVKAGVFDKVLCLGVLQHTPDPRKAFTCLVACLKPGGSIVCDIYRRSLVSMLQWKYFLRPLLAGMDKRRLYALVERVAPLFIGPSGLARKIFGRAGARLFPIVEYSHLGLPPELNSEWAILDTFDMYAPVYDQPQTAAAVRSWCAEAGLVDIDVRNGANGIIVRAKKPVL